MSAGVASPPWRSCKDVRPDSDPLRGKSMPLTRPAHTAACTSAPCLPTVCVWSFFEIK